MNSKSNVAEKKGTKVKMTSEYMLMKRYQVQFQKDGHLHSETNNVEQAKYYARSLANWNLAAQVYDRSTQAIIFRARAYAEKKQLDLMDEDQCGAVSELGAPNFEASHEQTQSSAG